LICSAFSSTWLRCVEKSSHYILHIPREIVHALVSLYIGPRIAYNDVNAQGGNLKKRENTMAPKKKATKKLRKAKKMQPTKPLLVPVDGGTTK
jgi:hypothetical protein